MSDMSKLNELMRELWEQTHETNPEVAAEKLFSVIPGADFTSTYIGLIQNAYSTYLSSVGAHKDKPERRSRPTPNPSRQRDEILAQIAYRPFRVPSRGAVRVHFQDMTTEYWDEWIAAKESRINGYRANITWGESIKALHAEHGVTRSGELPDDVKVELFRAPGSPDGNTE